jgi:hypothetical protein
MLAISQGRPILALEFTESGQEEAGKGLKIPVCEGSSLHAIPFRQEAAIHRMPIGHGVAVPLFRATHFFPFCARDEWVCRHAAHHKKG